MVYEYKGRWMRWMNECVDMLEGYYCDCKKGMKGCMYSERGHEHCRHQ